MLDRVFSVEIYYSTSKPHSLDEYLQRFTQEIEPILRGGFNYSSKKFTVTIKAVLCDTPAKAFVKATKSFSGFYGCDKCCTRGTYFGRMTFQATDSPLCTDESFEHNIIRVFPP